MEHLISSTIGLIHLIFSILSLIFGTIVLLKTKGTKRHRKIGYLYVWSMIGVIVTAFMTYGLYGKFGMFHYMAIVSALTLAAGILPMLFKKPKNYLSLHLGFMYWSVIGLYAAFVAETFVRIPKVVMESGTPNSAFYSMVGIGIGLVMFFGAFFFIKKSKKWENLIADK